MKQPAAQSSSLLFSHLQHLRPRCEAVSTLPRLLVCGSPANHRYGKAECCELLAFHGEETVRHVVSDRIPVADKPFTKVRRVQEDVSMRSVVLDPGQEHNG